jgi:hypothetical protein
MSPLRLGCAVAALTALLWHVGAILPWYPRPWTALDLHWYVFPVYDIFYGAVRQGMPMLWNPYQLCGTPVLGTLQGGFFYPPHVLYVLLPTPWALGLSTVLHLALAAGGTAAFARRAGIGPTGAALAAAVFTLSGPLRGMQLWPNMLEAAAWLPFGAIAILDLTGTAPRRGTVVLALASGMSWLAGFPQLTVFACYAWAALAVARLLVARPPIAESAVAVGGLAVGLVAGALLAAVALLPALELTREGVRRTSALDVHFLYPFGAPPPRRLWSLWFGTGPQVLPIVALGLAPLALISGSYALVLWCLVLVGFAVAFALGPATPLFKLYLLFPLLGWFRIPHRALIVAQLALSIIAGLGLDVAARRLRWRAAPSLALFVLLAVAIHEGRRMPEPVPPLPYRAAPVVYSPAHRAAYARLAATIGDLRAWPFSPGLWQYSFPPKLPTLTHLRTIDDYEPQLLRRPREYFAYLVEGGLPSAWLPQGVLIRTLAPRQSIEPPSARRRLLDLAGVRFMIMPPPTTMRPEVAAFVREAGFEARPPLAAGLEVYENPHVLPRAFVTYRASPAPPVEKLLPLLARASFDPLAESWVEGDAGLAGSGDPPARGAAATIVRDDPQVVEIDAMLAAPGLVVLADTYYPGWTATVDGARAAILPTNHLFRGVRSPAGRHRIRFEYRPSSLALGAAVSLLTALALAAGAHRLRTRAAA